MAVNASIVMQVVTCLAIFAEILTLNVFGIQTAYAANPASATDYIDLNKNILGYLCISPDGMFKVFGIAVVIGIVIYVLIKVQKKIMKEI